MHEKQQLHKNKHLDNDEAVSGGSGNFWLWTLSFTLLTSTWMLWHYYGQDDLVPGFLKKYNKMVPDSAFLDRDILPAHVKPVHYELHLWPNLETFKFKGTVNVHLQVLKPTKVVHLNANELELLSGHVMSVGEAGQSKRINVTNIALDAKAETAALTLEHELPVGSKAILTVDYTGTHNDKMAGFYRASYEDERTKEKKHMVVTQFEPTDARKAFPCWDEPNLKATFDVKLTVQKHLTALANMPEVESKTEGDFKTVKFQTSPIMSTYLVAFAAAELEFIESQTSDGKTKFRVYTLPGSIHQTQFALETGVKVLEFFVNYFDLAYPLPKMDFLAVPDFNAGVRSSSLITLSN